MLTESPHNASAVYVVDDGADYRLLVGQVFAHFLPQYTVSLFDGGDALLRHLQTSRAHPALILLDLHMPGMSGLQTLTQLKRDYPENDSAGAGPATADRPLRDRPLWDRLSRDRPLRLIPVVVVTSSSSAQEIQECYEAGANSCLAKPIGLDPMRHCLALICAYWMNTNRQVLT